MAITDSITDPGKPGCEAESERLHEFLQRSLTLPGQLGVRVVRPATGRGSRYWHGSQTDIKSTNQSKTQT